MISQLLISTKLTPSGNTQLDDYFVSPPFKLMTLPDYSTNKAEAWQKGLNAMQMSSSPGLLSGDRLDIQISLRKSTALTLTTQAFTRVQAMNDGEFAEQITQIQLAEDSRLFYLPHPLVLHKDSALKQKTTIEMAENSELIYGEIVAIGRVLNDERFAFRCFSSHLKIYALQKNGEKRPLVSDCIQWLPSKMTLTALSQMEDYSHQGSFLYLSLEKDALALKEMLKQLQSEFSNNGNLLIGFSLLNEGGIIVRALGYKAEQLQMLFEQIGHFIKSEADS